MVVVGVVRIRSVGGGMGSIGYAMVLMLVVGNIITRGVVGL